MLHCKLVSMNRHVLSLTNAYFRTHGSFALHSRLVAALVKAFMSKPVGLGGAMMMAETETGEFAGGEDGCFPEVPQTHRRVVPGCRC